MKLTCKAYFLLLTLLASGGTAPAAAEGDILVSFELYNDSPLMGLWWMPSILAQENGGAAQDGNELLLTLQPGDDAGYTHGTAITVSLHSPERNNPVFGLETRLFTEPAGAARSDGSQDQYFAEETALSAGFGTKETHEWFYLGAGAEARLLNDRMVTPLASGQQRLFHEAFPHLVDYHYLPGDRGTVFDAGVHLLAGVQDAGGMDRALRKVFPGARQVGISLESDLVAGAGTGAAQRFVGWNGGITLGAGKRANPLRRRMELDFARSLEWRTTGSTETNRARLTVSFRTVSFYLEPVYLTRQDKELFHFTIQETERTGFVMGLTWYAGRK